MLYQSGYTCHIFRKTDFSILYILLYMYIVWKTEHCDSSENSANVLLKCVKPLIKMKGYCTTYSFNVNYLELYLISHAKFQRKPKQFLKPIYI